MSRQSHSIQSNVSRTTKNNTVLLGVTDKIVTNSNVSIDENLELITIIPDVQNKMDYVYEKYDLGKP